MSNKKHKNNRIYKSMKPIIRMTLDSAQVEQIKQHLLKQIGNFPEEQREIIKQKILSMNNEETENFIKQNQLTHLNEDETKKEETKCIFCAIIEKKVPTYILEENKSNIAILEINPLSKGHSMIVPKKHLKLEKIPSSSFILAKKIVQRINKKFMPIEVKINSQKIMGHSLLEVLPIYGNETERKKATEEELLELQTILKAPEKIVKITTTKKKKGKKKNNNIPILPPRIP